MSDFRERRQRVTDTDSPLLLLEIHAASFTGTLYAVNDTRNWTSNGVEYVGVPFGFKLPDDVSGNTPAAQLVMNNGGRGISDELERLQPNEEVTAVLRLTDRADPDVIEHEYILPLTHVNVIGTTATAKCGVDYLMRQQAVRVRATPFTLPGIFQ